MVTSNGLAKLNWQNSKYGPNSYFLRWKFSSRRRLQGPSKSGTNTQTLGTMETRCAYWKDRRIHGHDVRTSPTDGLMKIASPTAGVDVQRSAEPKDLGLQLSAGRKRRW